MDDREPLDLPTFPLCVDTDARRIRALYKFANEICRTCRRANFLDRDGITRICPEYQTRLNWVFQRPGYEECKLSSCDREFLIRPQTQEEHSR